MAKRHPIIDISSKYSKSDPRHYLNEYGIAVFDNVIAYYDFWCRQRWPDTYKGTGLVTENFKCDHSKFKTRDEFLASLSHSGRKSQRHWELFLRLNNYCRKRDIDPRIWIDSVCVQRANNEDTELAAVCPTVEEVTAVGLISIDGDDITMDAYLNHTRNWKDDIDIRGCYWSNSFSDGKFSIAHKNGTLTRDEWLQYHTKWVYDLIDDNVSVAEFRQYVRQILYCIGGPFYRKADTDSLEFDGPVCKWVLGRNRSLFDCLYNNFMYLQYSAFIMDNNADYAGLECHPVMLYLMPMTNMVIDYASSTVSTTNLSPAALACPNPPRVHGFFNYLDTHPVYRNVLRDELCSLLDNEGLPHVVPAYPHIPGNESTLHGIQHYQHWTYVIATMRDGNKTRNVYFSDVIPKEHWKYYGVSDGEHIDPEFDLIERFSDESMAALTQDLELIKPFMV